MERTPFEEDDPPPDESSEPGGNAVFQSTSPSRFPAGSPPNPVPVRRSSSRSLKGEVTATLTTRKFVSLFPEHLSVPSALAVSGKTSPHIRWFRRRFYPDASNAQWNDWRWQLARRIRTMEELERILPLTAGEREAFLAWGNRLPVSITPYYASLIDAGDPEHPLRRTVVPTIAEAAVNPGEEADPLHEEGDTPVPGLVHRYPDRALFLVTDFCSVNCRYCTRSRMVGRHGDEGYARRQWEQAAAYIEAHPEIRDVLVSGGDPLTLSDEALEWILARLRRISHVEIIRIGTKVPAVLPQRITPVLVRMLKKYHPLMISIHATHPEELTHEMQQALNRLADAGIPLGSQTVLLAGINDSVETMKRLMHGLLKARVRPYYLYQCDPISGSAHFRTPVEKGLEIIEGLRGHTSGYAVPHYVIDAPGGGGKIPLLPEYYQGRDGDDVILRNYRGELFRYPDTAARRCHDTVKPESASVWRCSGAADTHR